MQRIIPITLILALATLSGGCNSDPAGPVESSTGTSDENSGAVNSTPGTDTTPGAESSSRTAGSALPGSASANSGGANPGSASPGSAHSGSARSPDRGGITIPAASGGNAANAGEQGTPQDSSDSDDGNSRVIRGIGQSILYGIAEALQERAAESGQARQAGDDDPFPEGEPGLPQRQQ